VACGVLFWRDIKNSLMKSKNIFQSKTSLLYKSFMSAKPVCHNNIILKPTVEISWHIYIRKVK
jgi:hypothetical protein